MNVGGVYQYTNLHPDDKLFIDGFSAAMERMVVCISNLNNYDLTVEGCDIDINLLFNNHPELLEALEDAFSSFMESEKADQIVSCIDYYPEEEIESFPEWND